MPFENLPGLPLDEARQLLDEEPVVVHSAPPFFPRGYTAHFGRERVVRARSLADGKIELLVARELISEERVANDKGAGGKESAGR